jgi:hypothetical protein
VTRRGLVGRVLLVLASLAAAAPALGSDRYDPRLRFRSLATPHFDVHFHQGEEALARRLAALAEQVRRDLEPKLGLPNGRVHVILVDQHDSPNGWATPFPYNVIEITAAVPRGGSVIGNTTDWLRLVFVHEYTHILHLDRSKGIFGAARRVVGRHPFVLPNVFTPPWQIEGIATHYESATTREGRVPAGDFRLLLDRAAASGRFATLDRASHDRIDWPAGHTPYLYGAYFHEYLAATYGEASLDRLADETARRVPYLGVRAFQSVFGKPLGALWDDFAASTRATAPARPAAAMRLTEDGFVVSSPVYARDGRLFYAASNPHGFPSIREWLAPGRSREVVSRFGANRVSVAGSGTLVFDQLEYVRSVGLQSDLYAVDLAAPAMRRLTREVRAADPDVSPDGTRLVLTLQQADRRVLATMPVDASSPPASLVDEAESHFAAPRWSPDGRRIAAERRVRGGPSEVVIVEAATGDMRVLPSVGGRSITPVWTPDGSGLLFASDASGGAFQIRHVDLATGQLRELAQTGPSAQAPALSPDGQTLVFVGYSDGGYDLYSLPWADAEWVSPPAPPNGGGAPVESPTSDPVTLTDRPYRPWAMLLPRFWTPVVEPDDDELSIGAATAGADALGRHAYAAGLAWSNRARPDWYAAYYYDRWRPTLLLTAADDTDPWLTGTIRSQEVNAGASIAFRTTRRTQSLFALAHISSDRVTCAGCDDGIDVALRRHALRGGWSLNTAKLFGYSISRERGLSVSAGGEWAPQAFGSTGDSTALVVEMRGFLPAGGGHRVLALRGAAAASWGDDGAARIFGAGGAGREPQGVAFGRDAIGLLRGFDLDVVAGRRAAVINADYRVPLAWIERGVGTWPAFVRSVHAAVFADAGAAWTDRLRDDDVRFSTGAEVSADLVVGYILPVTVAAGAAWRYDPTRAARGVAVFGRVGRAF